MMKLVYCILQQPRIPGLHKHLKEDLPDLIEDMEEIKKWCAPNTIGYYSYNLNYYKQFLDLLEESASRFSNLSLINMRVDVIAAQPDYLKLAKRLGLVRVSMAVEGMGDRVRNKILNKNLSHDQLMKAVRNVFDGKFIMLKMGMILTGQETDEDIDEWIAEIDKIS